MSDIQPDDIFGGAAHRVDARLLAVRRGQPIKDYGALFPGGRLWLTILIVSYVELAVVEGSGIEAWQPVTGYLWLQLYVGLIPTVWRWMRPATRHEVDAERRAAEAPNADEAPGVGARSHRAQPLDEDDKPIEKAPAAWVDELTPEREKTLDLPQTIMRIILTPALWIAAIVPLQLGLDIVVWARQHWQIALPVSLALLVASWFVYQRLRPHRPRAPEMPESAGEASPHEAVANAGFGEDVLRGGGLGLDALAQLADQHAQVGQVVGVGRAPDGDQQLAVGQHLAVPLGEPGQ